MADNWKNMTAGQQAPSNGLIGGRDIDGSPIFVGRAHHNGELLPAKVIPNTFRAFVSHAGRELRKDDFQILCGGKYDWVPDTNGSVPRNAVGGGYDSDGAALYVGRVRHSGSTTIGKIQPRNGVCYIPFNGQELNFTHYEVLVRSN